MTQIYHVREWKPWKDVADEDGNQLGSVTFEEHNSEPVDIRVKKDLKPGQQLKGQIKQSKKGRLTFFMAEPDRDKKITASWAIGLALGVAPDHNDFEWIENYAGALMEMQGRLAE